MRADTIDRECLFELDDRRLDEVEASRRCLLVLGMHRSGTSAVCGTLAELGAERPVRELLPQADNEKGFFEPAEIVTIHDRVLAAAGTSWLGWDPLPESFYETAECTALRGELVEAFLEDFPGTGAFILKDPRLCRLVGLWTSILNELGAATVVINVFRHPIEVARSLGSRDALSTGHCLLLWLRYVVDAESASRGLPRAFVAYSNVIDDWRDELATALEKLNLRLPNLSILADPGADGFIEPKLRHHTLKMEDSEADARVHSWIEDAFTALHVLHENPYAAGAMQTLDRIRREFDTACAAFEPALQGFLRDVHDLRVDRDGMRAHLKDTRERLALVQSIADRVPGLEAELKFLGEALLRAAPLADKVLDLEAKIGRMSLDVPWRWTGIMDTSDH